MCHTSRHYKTSSLPVSWREKRATPSDILYLRNGMKKRRYNNLLTISLERKSAPLWNSFTVMTSWRFSHSRDNCLLLVTYYFEWNLASLSNFLCPRDLSWQLAKPLHLRNNHLRINNASLTNILSSCVFSAY